MVYRLSIQAYIYNMLYRGYTVILSSSEMCSRQSMIRGRQRVLNAATGSPMLESHMGHGSLNQKDTWGVYQPTFEHLGKYIHKRTKCGLLDSKVHTFALHLRMVGKIDPVDWNKPKQFSVMAWTGLRIAVCQRFSMWDSEILMLKPLKPCFYYYSLVVKPCSAGFHSHFWLVVPRHSVSPYNSW